MSAMSELTLRLCEHDLDALYSHVFLIADFVEQGALEKVIYEHGVLVSRANLMQGRQCCMIFRFKASRKLDICLLCFTIAFLSVSFRLYRVIGTVRCFLATFSAILLSTARQNLKQRVIFKREPLNIIAKQLNNSITVKSLNVQFLLTVHLFKTSVVFHTMLLASVCDM